MTDALDPRDADNLRRWKDSGQPRSWIEAHQGQWNHADWQSLVESLRQSDFWPMDLEAVSGVLDEVKKQASNLRRWQEVGLPRLWVGSHHGQWNHDDWRALVEILKRSAFWPLDLDAVAVALEEVKRRYWNLHRWKASGQPGRWLASYQGEWAHSDWLALVESLQQSDFWPMYLDAVSGVLEEVKRANANLQRLQEEGLPQLWVRSHGGRWNHDDWLALLDLLKRLGFWPLDLGAGTGAGGGGTGRPGCELDRLMRNPVPRAFSCPKRRSSFPQHAIRPLHLQRTAP